ncbi:coiled-coil domain-containing protein [Actinomadura rugatobispora]|uniref:Coiled-coil domain-containing protein n=1 Tax=Actinomadura rugatobispora TaxID=1994 RepID=A0ABW1AEX0_9ACTN
MRARAARSCAVIALLAAASAALPAGPGSAAGLALAPDDPKELAKLEKRAAQLSKDYRGELVSLDEAKTAAQRARKDAERLAREFEVARSDVRRIAASTYMTGRLDTTTMVSADDPRAAVRDAAVIEHMSRNNGMRLQSLETLSVQAAQSQRTAKTKVDQVRKEVEDLEGQRARVKKLLAKYKPEAPVAPSSPAGRPDGAGGTKSSIIGNSMTARMRTAMVAIDSKFGPFPAIGCARPGDAQDHGKGQACDFMESTGGQMPSASARAHGDAVAQYVIDNASRLGIKYVIWRQRIYDMRGSGGWRQMEDRGSITQNHYDHVHVSVL